jgi:hypothetical protein
MLSNLLGVLMLGTVAVVLRQAHVGTGLLVWICLVLVNIGVFHFGLLWHLKHEPDSAAGLRLQNWTMSGLFALGGLAWGSVTFLVVPAGPWASYWAIPCIVVITAVAANIAFASATPTLFVSFHLTVTFTATAGLLSVGVFSLAA